MIVLAPGQLPSLPCRSWPRWLPSPAMMQRDRKHEGLRVCRGAWLIGVSVREYRVLEAEERFPDPVTWERICELYGWPQRFASGRSQE